jgi:hypothetical protein
MKNKIAIYIIILLFVGAGLFSYAKSKGQANRAARSFTGQLSPMKTQLALYGDPEVAPCWIFRAEYKGPNSDGTFYVYVSLLGKVKKISSKSKLLKN